MTNLIAPVRAADAVSRANTWSKTPRRNTAAWFGAFTFCLAVSCVEGWLNSYAASALFAVLALPCLGVSFFCAFKSDRAGRHRSGRVSAGQEVS